MAPPLPPIFILAPLGSATSFTYQVARCQVSTNFSLPALQPFTTATPTTIPCQWQKPPESVPQGKAIYNQKAWLGSAMQHITCVEQPLGYWLSIVGVGTFSITFSATHTTIHTNTKAPIALQEEILLGPLLLLTLAKQNIYCLHASSILRNNSAIAFLGDSGQGKSTLSQFLYQAGATLIADDLLVIHIEDNQPWVCPHFPQLKLAQQADSRLPAKIPLAAIFRLHKHATLKPTLNTNILSPSLALLEMVKHTVAVRLFNPQQSIRHLAFCALAASAQPFHQLSYPDDPSLLPKIKQLLESHLE